MTEGGAPWQLRRSPHTVRHEPDKVCGRRVLLCTLASTGLMACHRGRATSRRAVSRFTMSCADGRERVTGAGLGAHCGMLEQGGRRCVRANYATQPRRGQHAGRHLRRRRSLPGHRLPGAASLPSTPPPPPPPARQGVPTAPPHMWPNCSVVLLTECNQDGACEMVLPALQLTNSPVSAPYICSSSLCTGTTEPQ